jgi:glucose-1-phosphate thymidylyltransferase
MRGILLAGGTGSRLRPITQAISKQLMPIFDKPMVYYPMTTLICAGIREILVITTLEDQPQFKRLLRDGGQFGLEISYAVQPRPAGIAQAFTIGADFIGEQPVALILGDNIFHGTDLARQLSSHATPVGGRIFAYPVVRPQDYGVVEFDQSGRVLSIEEKPARARSRYAVPGLYFYDSRVVEFARALTPGPRGELEITDINEAYRHIGQLHVTVLSRDTAWLDTGTFRSLLQATEFVQVIEECHGLKIGCVEEAAWRAGFIDDDQLKTLAQPLMKSGYGNYLVELLTEPDRLISSQSGPEHGSIAVGLTTT